MKPQQKRTKEAIKLSMTKKKITKVSKKKCIHASCPCIIPKDIIFSQILPRLSFKFLCMLKCISKEWYHIISYQRHFMLQQSCCVSAVPASYICLNINTLCILPTRGNPSGIPDPSFMTILRNSNNLTSSYVITKLVASTNGLLCFLCSIIKISVSQFHIVCNPATRESEFIPFHSSKAGNSYVIGRGYGLAFDPSAIPASYKLVQLLLKSSPSRSKFFGLISIYSSYTGRWIESKVHVSISSSFEKLYEDTLAMKSVFVRGVIFWKLSRDHLLYYDIENDAANTISFPKSNARVYFEEIGQSGGCAALTRITGTTLDFWMLLGYGHNPSWKLMHRASFKGILDRFTREFWCLQPLPCNNDDEMIYIHIRGPTGKNELVCYDIKGRKLVRCGSFPVKKLRFTSLNWIFSYNNSLVVLPRKGAKNYPSPNLLFESSCMHSFNC